LTMSLKLAYGLKFTDLYQAEQLVDKAFLQYLQDADSSIHAALLNARSQHLPPKEESALIIALAPVLEDFTAHLFGIEKELQQLQASHHALAPLYSCKRLFVQRVVAKSCTAEMVGDIAEVIAGLKEQGLNPEDELAFAIAVQSWQESTTLELAKRYAAWALFTAEGIKTHQSGELFKIPKKSDYANLLPQLHSKPECGKHLPADQVKARDGFSLHEDKISLEYALSNSNYCILCHNQGKDSCSKGMAEFKPNALDVKLLGCPLEEKISEMHTLKNQGTPIGALATAIIDNPMIAGTGHRICNDCMKACIYQKQDPVDIPAVESRVLNDVISLPWGFEIYSLFTRWNPLNFRKHLPSPTSRYKTLVVGLGPAGFTLAHYLLNNGINVVAIDGLKIEPIDQGLSGISQDGQRTEFQPIFNIQSIFEDLAERKAGGFGGVAEYGITVRWDKNYLKIIRLLLERRQHFRMYGGIRFGSNISTDDAFAMGFDHISLSMGAGKPNLPEIPNIMANGVRTASDFLMTLQLSGAGRYDSITNLTIELPAVVLGGGLTAIDTATETIAYYMVQVEKLLRRYEAVGEGLLSYLNEQERSSVMQQLEHARKLRASDNKIQLIRQWGGVKVLYRKSLAEAPCYRLNHEEVAKAMAEGIEFLEYITPQKIEVDELGHCTGVHHQNGFIPARSILVAIGTSPNTVISREEDGYPLDGQYFQATTSEGINISPERMAKAKGASVLHSTSRGISFFGDLHPSYAGNVVKAMASAKNGHHQVVDLLHSRPAKSDDAAAIFFQQLDQQLLAKVHRVVNLTSNIVEVIVHAPLAAKRFKPGQFYRLQNYEAANLGMEGLALTGAWVDVENGLLGMIVLEMGGSSNLCRALQPNEAIVLMGPTGSPSEIPSNEKIMLVGGGLGNAVLLSIGKAMRDNGCEVIYFAGYKKMSDIYKVEDIEQAANQVVWCCDEGLLPSNRPQDLSFHSNIVESIRHYGQSNPGTLEQIDRILVIGSDKMMQAVAIARHNSLNKFFKKGHIAIGSINSPMQCMMKEICGQCLQRQVDPETGEERYVYSCFNQDQNLDCVDFNNLHLRLSQNSAQEKITRKWLEGVY